MLATGALQAGLGVLFATAVAAKVAAAGRFRDAVAGYVLVPAPLATPVAVGVAAAELGCAVLLLTSTAVAGTATVAAGLLLALAAAMTANLVAGRIVDCGCGGRAHSVSWRLVGRDVGLAAAAGWLATQPASAPASVAILAGAALALLLAWQLAVVARELRTTAARLGPRLVEAGR